MDTAELSADAALEVLARRLIILRAKEIAAGANVPDAAFCLAYAVLADRAEEDV